MRLIQLGIRFDGADQAKRDLRDVAAAEQSVTDNAEKLAAAQKKAEDSARAMQQAQDKVTQQLKAVIVEADGSITRFTKLDQIMSRLDDRSLRKIEAGTLSVDQAVRQLQSNADKSAASLGRQSTAVDKTSAVMGGLVNAYTLVGAATVAGAKYVLGYADNLDTMSQRAGMGVEVFQRVAYAAKQNNVEMGALTTGVQNLQDKIAGRDKSAVAALTMLGLSFDSFKKLKPEDQLLAVSDALKGVTDHDEQVQILNDLFGKQGKELLPLIAGNMREVMNAAHVMSAKTVKDLADTNDSLDDIKTSLTSIAGELLSLTGATWLIKIAAQDLRNPQSPGAYFGQVGNTISQLAGMGLYGMTAGGVGQAGWDPLAYRRAGGYTGRGDIDLPTDGGAGVPGGFIEDSPWDEGGTLGDYLASQKGKKAPKDLKGTQFPWLFYGTPGDVSGRTGDYDYSFWNTRNTANVDWLGKGTSLQDMALRYGMMGGAPPIEGRMPATAAAAPGMLSQFGSMFSQGLPNIILSAITGGGNVMQSIGGLGGTSLATSLMGDLGKKIGGKVVGGTLGSIFGSLIPGLGGLLGSGLGSLFGKLFGPSQGKKDAIAAEGQINQMQAQLLQQYGGMDNLKSLGQEAGVDITAAWGDKNVAGAAHFQQSSQDFQAAVQAQAQIKDLRQQLLDTYGSMDNLKDLSSILGVNLAGAFGPDTKGVKGLQSMQTLMQQFNKQQTQLNGAIDKYGLTLDDLGPKYQAFTVKTEMKGLLDDWNSLIGAGADENAVLTKMAGSWSSVAEEALKYGTQLDPQLQPILQKLSDMGLLLDDQKHKIDLAALSFGGPNDTSFLSQAMGALGKVSGQINDFPNLINVDFHADQSGDWPDPNAYPGGDNGGSGGDQSRKGGTPADSNGDGHPGFMGGYITPYGVQRLTRGGQVYRGIGVDTVPLWGEPGEGMLSKLGMQALGRLNSGLSVGSGTVHLHLHDAYIDSDRRVEQITTSVVKKMTEQLSRGLRLPGH